MSLKYNSVIGLSEIRPDAVNAAQWFLTRIDGVFEAMEITLSVLLVVAAGVATFWGSHLASKRRFRAEILRLATDASLQDFEAMSELEEKHRVPKSVSLAFYVAFFTRLHDGESELEATKAGVAAMLECRDYLSSTDISFYSESPGLKNFRKHNA